MAEDRSKESLMSGVQHKLRVMMKSSQPPCKARAVPALVAMTCRHGNHGGAAQPRNAAGCRYKAISGGPKLSCFTPGFTDTYLQHPIVRRPVSVIQYPNLRIEAGSLSLIRIGG